MDDKSEPLQIIKKAICTALVINMRKEERAMEGQPVLWFQQIKKKFGENVVLDGVDFKVMPGEIVSLVGENGAGKSTLMNILFGMSVIRQTGGYEGTIYMDGNPLNITNPNDAIHQGIGMVHQEFMLIPGFTVEQNIKLNREPLKKNIFSRVFGHSFETIDWEAENRDAKKALKRIGIDVNPGERIEQLPVGLKQFVEISREIDKENLKVLIFDEPTAVLTETEAEKLLKCIKSFSESGIAVIFISHRLDEVMRISDKVVVLRDGILVENAAVTSLTKEKIAELMVGRKLTERTEEYPDRNIKEEDIILEFRNVSVDMPGEDLRGFSLKVRRGEIIGIGGLAGHGKMAVSNAVSGMYPSTGEVLYNGKPLDVSKTGEALRHEIAFVSEDRKGVGLLLDQSILTNIIFNNLSLKGEFLKSYGFFTQIDNKAAKKTAEQMIEDLAIRCTSAEQLAGSLSGGNQQKVCMARALIAEPKLLFVSEPTRGIDIGAKRLILDYLLKINYEKGITVVMLSSELNELREVCDRIAIVAGGRLRGILGPKESNVKYALMMSGDESVRGGEDSYEKD